MQLPVEATVDFEAWVAAKEMRLLVRLGLVGALLLWVLAACRSESLPLPEELVAAVRREPRQSATAREPFAVTVGGIRYRVEPQYDYEIQGLVVSEHRSESWWRRTTFHRMASDFLNVKDLCVVWGPTAMAGVYRGMEFSSGEFTCYARPRSAEAARHFDPTALSNNHLLAAEEGLRERLRKLRRGDQIRLRGQLAAYGHDHGFPFRRGTSTRRDDTGNGACETIYVNELEVLRPGNGLWRGVAGVAPMGLVAAGIAWLRLPLPKRR
jgi:hypothetical protein